MFISFNYLIALVIVLTLHEFSHAWVATKLGDITPERAGRLTLNPLRHLDLIGTLMLFIAGFGWGKPVPVNPRNFKNPIRDEAMTAVAGPMMNLMIAIVASIFLNYLPIPELKFFWGALIDLSIVLFIFNLLPFSPLDGSKFFILLFPISKRAAYQEFLIKSMPYFLAFMIFDLYFLDKIIGFSIIWKLVETLSFWLKAAILVVV